MKTKRLKPPNTASNLPSEEDLARLLVAEVTDYAIFVVDRQNRIVTWNRGARQMLGFKPDEVIGRDGGMIFTPEDRAAGAVEGELRVARREGRAINERWHVRKDKSRFWGSGIMMRLTDDGGKHIGYSKILRDRTERKQLEDQVRALNADLERRVAERTNELLAHQQRLRALALETVNAEQRARDQIAADLHDNLAQTLAVCMMKMGAAGAALGRDGDRPPAYAEAMQYLETVLRQTRALMYSLSPMIVGGQLRSALEWVQQQMAQHGLEVVIHHDARVRKLDDEVLRIVYRAVQELLWNVVKHARVNRAEVTVRRTGGAIRITVADQGRGFNPARITRASESGGFGLFSLRERLTALGGGMQIKSASGKGTQVTVELPVRGSPTAARSGGPSNGRTAKRGGARQTKR